MTNQPHAGVRAHLLLLTLVAMVVGLPLIAGRVLSGQDIVNYLIIAQQTAANFREGAIFPVWAGGFNAGFGSPLLIFFPPLTGAVHSVPVLLGIPIINGVGVLSLVALLLSGAAAYGWLRSTGAGQAALPAAIVYMIAPYRFVDLYLRSALAEHWAFIWPPLILWLADSRRTPPALRTLLLALSVAALLATNIPLAVLFGIVLVIWFLVRWREREGRLQVCAGVALGFGLVTFMLVPQALAAKFLNLEVCFGPAATRFRPSANTLFAAGFGTWNLNTLFSLTLLSTFIVALLAYLRLPTEERRGSAERGLLAAATGCVVVTTGPFGQVWDNLPVLSNLQFPWRITAVLTLVTVALAARLTPRRSWQVVIVTLALAIPFSSWGRTMPQSTFRVPEPTRPKPGTVFPNPHTAWEAGSGGWYWRHENLVELCLIPKSMQPFMFDEFRGAPSPRLNQIRNRPAVVVDDSTSAVHVVKWGQTVREIEVNSARGGTVLWRILAFPGTEIFVDGVTMPFEADSATGLVTHLIAPGRHLVRYSWQPFPALRRARQVSMAAWSIVFVLAAMAAVGALRRT